MEEKKVSDETVEATNKDIAILNQKIEKLEKDLQEITEEKLNLVIQNEKLRQDKVKIFFFYFILYLKKRKIWMKCSLIQNCIILWFYKHKNY